MGKVSRGPWTIRGAHAGASGQAHFAFTTVAEAGHYWNTSLVASCASGCCLDDGS